MHHCGFEVGITLFLNYKMDKIKIDHKKLLELCNDFCKKYLLEYKRPDCIVVITSGAMIAGYYVANILGVRDIRTISMSSYI